MNSLVAQLAENTSVLYTYGPMGVVLAWFMWRGEKLAGKISDLAHRIDGLTRALLVDMIDREASGPHVKKYAQEAIASIDARDAMRKSREK